MREYRRRLPAEPEINREHLLGFIQTFIPRFNCYPCQQPDGHYHKVPRQLTVELVEQHIRGSLTIGAYALNDANQAKWLCLDADDSATWEGVLRLAQTLTHQALPVYLEPSRRGGHLWLFTDPLPSATIRRFAKQLTAQHSLERVEIYPKQDVLRTGPGSLVRLPLGIHRKADPPRRFTFKTLNGTDLASTVREQLALLAQPQRIPTAFIHDTLAHLPEPKPLFPTPTFRPRQVIDLDQPVSERIKAAISVRAFVSHYIDLDAQGRGLCPFHDDHRQSFSVREDGNYWHCFAGCEGQTIIDFWMQWQGVEFKQAVSELAKLLLPPLF